MAGQIEATAGGVVEETPLSQSEATAMFRQEATDALKRATGWMEGVTWFYRLGALAYALVTLFAILALARTDVPERAGVQVVVMTTLMGVLLVLAALRILFEPLVWNLLLASLATAVALFHFVGPNPLGIAFPASAVLAVLLWATLVPTLRIQRMIADHKDLYILHHASIRTRRSLKGRTPEERHERLIGAMGRAARRAWVSSGVAAAAIVLASVVGTNVVLSSMRPPELSAALATFETAWNASDLAAVGEHFDTRVRAPEVARLGGLIDGHGWRDAFPRLQDGRTREEGGRVSVDYELGDILLSSTWVVADQRWSLVHVELPVPPLEPILARFLEAWKTSDAGEIAAFFSKDSQAQMRESIEDAALGRVWSAFPDVFETRTSDYSKGDATVTLVLAAGEVKTKWILRSDGTWGLNELRFPPR